MAVYNFPSETLIPERGALLQAKQNTTDRSSEGGRNAGRGATKDKVALLFVIPEILKYLYYKNGKLKNRY